MFCAPTLTFCAFSSAAFTAAIAVNGGTSTISTSLDSPISQQKRPDERARFALGHVHLPIRGDDFFSHGSSGRDAFSEASD